MSLPVYTNLPFVFPSEERVARQPALARSLARELEKQKSTSCEASFSSRRRRRGGGGISSSPRCPIGASYTTRARDFDHKTVTTTCCRCPVKYRVRHARWPTASWNDNTTATPNLEHLNVREDKFDIVVREI